MLINFCERTVQWGECDPFGLVYYPHMLAWFNDTEHDAFRRVGLPIDKMIEANHTTFVMGEVKFRFTGPAAYGDRVTCIVELQSMGTSTLRYRTTALHTDSGAPVYEGSATRVYANIKADKTLGAATIPDDMREILGAANPLAVELSSVITKAYSQER
ncbi:MAG: acyl-CoA thioesterase [Pseudomonadota bacterium]